MSKKASPHQGNLFPAGNPANQRTLPTPHRKRGSPGPQNRETEGRDGALDDLEKWRSSLVEIGREVAIQLARRRKRITSVEVFAELRAQGYDAALDSCDPRWMGVVFREDIWQREGWETTGSHRRPVAIWSLRDPSNVPQSPREKVLRTVSAARSFGVTTGELVTATALGGNQVRTCLRDLHTLDKILPLGTRRKRQHVYVIPDHHPDII